jgi:hypothetical protein
MTTKNAVKKLTTELKSDSSFRESYKANIAIAFIDECNEWRDKNERETIPAKAFHEIANKAADRFLDSWCI